MATSTAVSVKPLNRDVLARFLPSHEAIRAFESLVRDVSTALPDAASSAQSTADAANALAAAANTLAGDAFSDAASAQATANDVNTRLTALEADLAAQYALLYDQDADPPTVAYICEAPPGTLTSAAGWRIQKLTFGVDGDVISKWADGNSNFDNVADNRASLTYL